MGGDRRLLFTGGPDHELSMWDAPALSCLKTFSGHTASIRTILLGVPPLSRKLLRHLLSIGALEPSIDGPPLQRGGDVHSQNC